MIKGKISVQYTKEFPKYGLFRFPVEGTEDEFISGQFYIEQKGQNTIIYTNCDIIGDAELEELLIMNLESLQAVLNEIGWGEFYYGYGYKKGQGACGALFQETSS